MKCVIKFFLFLLILLICSYCSSKNDKIEEKVISSDNLEEIEAIEFGNKNYFDTCFLIKLETNAEALIADMTQLEIFDDRIYIWEKSTDQLMCFDLQGNFKGNIGKKGRAPGEYAALSGFYINRWDSTINLFDPLSMSVKTYDTEGNYIKEIKHKNDDLCFVAKASMLDTTKIFC